MSRNLRPKNAKLRRLLTKQNPQPGDGKGNQITTHVPPANQINVKHAAARRSARIHLDARPEAR